MPWFTTTCSGTSSPSYWEYWQLKLIAAESFSRHCSEPTELLPSKSCLFSSGSPCIQCLFYEGNVNAWPFALRQDNFEDPSPLQSSPEDWLRPSCDWVSIQLLPLFSLTSFTFPQLLIWRAFLNTSGVKISISVCFLGNLTQDSCGATVV